MRVLLTDLGKIVSDQLLEGGIILDIDIPISRGDSSFLCLRELLRYNSILIEIDGLTSDALLCFNRFYLGVFFSETVNKDRSFTLAKIREDESFQVNGTVMTLYKSYSNSYQYPQAYIVKLSKIINSQFFTIIG